MVDKSRLFALVGGLKPGWSNPCPT